MTDAINPDPSHPAIRTRGRPKLGDRLVRGVIAFRLNSDERSVIERAAAIRNQDVTSWIRTASVATSQKVIQAQIASIQQATATQQ